MSTHNIPFSTYKRKSPLIILNLQLWNSFQEAQERVRNSRGKRAISVRASEVLLYSDISSLFTVNLFYTCSGQFVP